MATTTEEREKRKKERLKRDNKASMGGCFVFIVFLVVVITIAYIMVNDKTTGNNMTAVEQIKWSKEAQQEASNRVNLWVSDGQIKIDIESNEAYIAPLFWGMADFEQKKEILSTLLIYQDVRLQRNDNPITLYDKQTGKELASWSSFSGFDFNN